jgi:hypothetical protein
MPTASKTTHFVGGHWFNGQRFVPEDFYAVGGVLIHDAPKHVDETVGLGGGYVVPPFGDAHEHNFDSLESTPKMVETYLRDAVFYAQGMTDVTSGSSPVVKARMVDTPMSVDVTVRAVELGNLTRLKKAGVPILVGSDWYGSDSLHEIGYLHDLGIWSNAELLTMYAVTTPKTFSHDERSAS